MTTEKFLEGLKRACPYLFEEDELNGAEKSNSSVTDESKDESNQPDAGEAVGQKC
ncbi:MULTISPECIES: hypothetical protein [Aerosakkonema]|uniref:hypothetical protein n=1 Tax=Aerosakkonema TaxID=1246629 RepID=UPI0035B87A44